MASEPNIEHVKNPDPLRDLPAKERPEDCLPCRVMGASAFVGLGTYSYFSGHSQLRAQQAQILHSNSIFGMRSRQAGITSIAFTLVGVGLWRLVN